MREGSEAFYCGFESGRTMRPIVVSTSPTANRLVDPGPILMTGDIDSIIDQTLRAGANGVELRLTEKDRGDLPVIKRKLENANLIVGGISTGRIAREGGHCLTDTSEAARQRAAMQG